MTGTKDCIVDMDVLIAECKQEVSSFNPVPSRYEDFVVLRGEGILQRHRGGRGEVAGAMSVFAGRDDVYAMRWENQRSGKGGWGPAVKGGWGNARRPDREYLPFTDEVAPFAPR